ncbi:alpha/beta fold hydrolase [Microbacterium sp. NPDC058345]|uniref:alpha/beta fold hydrolase n=1 Tax=Microbacterium sp. NPDC058345 TaxID=3346455 RepID=UPI00364A1B31
MSIPPRLRLHGANRAGLEAWPDADADHDRFLAFAPGAPVADCAARLRHAIEPGRTVVFAHSIGGVAAVLAASLVRPAGLVLVEPALYDVARGHRAVEQHIAAITEARAQVDEAGLRAFWAILRPVMFAGSFDPADDEGWKRERAVAEHWSVAELPWGHGVRVGMVRDLPTLVVTGGWNAEYEEIARLLTGEGAEHVVLAGAGHRPQDLPGFAPAVRAFDARLRTAHDAPRGPGGQDAAARSPTR